MNGQTTWNRLARTVLVVLHGLAGLLAVDTAASADDPWHIAVGAGRSLPRDVDITRVAVGRAFRVTWLKERWDISPRWEITVDSWRPSQPPLGGERSINAASIRIILEKPLGANTPFLVELGTGPTYISRREVDDDLDLGSRIQFDSHLGIGGFIGEESRWKLTYELHHISNASIGATNPGLNFHLVRLAYRF